MSKALWLFLAMVLTTVSGGWSAASDAPDRPQPKVGGSLKHDTSPPLREIQPAPPTGQPQYREIPRFRRPPGSKSRDREVEGNLGDPAIQDWHGALTLTTPLQSFEGVSNADNAAVAGGQVLPPDTNGDVGPNHYVQWVNISLAVFSKTGTVLAGQIPGNALWSGFGGVCETTNQGDPIVLYDHLADRWFLSQFAFERDADGNPVGPFFQCIAVSTSPDPTATYFRYGFHISDTKINDYPKFGVWPDGYYLSVNQFDMSMGGAFAGVGVAAFERDKMLQGLPAQMIFFDLASADPSFFGLLPSDLDGTPPPIGTPNVFAAFAEAPDDHLNLWEFHVNFSTPGPRLLASTDSRTPCSLLSSSAPTSACYVPSSFIVSRSRIRASASTPSPTSSCFACNTGFLAPIRPSSPTIRSMPGRFSLKKPASGGMNCGIPGAVGASCSRGPTLPTATRGGWGALRWIAAATSPWGTACRAPRPSRLSGMPVAWRQMPPEPFPRRRPSCSRVGARRRTRHAAGGITACWQSTRPTIARFGTPRSTMPPRATSIGRRASDLSDSPSALLHDGVLCVSECFRTQTALAGVTGSRDSRNSWRR